MDRADSTVEKSQIDDRVQTFRDERKAFSDDPYLPQYHFVPPGGILHDPNGACYWNGKYHLFYQHWPSDQDKNLDWSEAMHWGHAVSDDLVHWRDLPTALSPDSGPEASCYSGQALVEDDRVILMYHGSKVGNCIATSSDPLLTDFEKHPENPVIPIDSDVPYAVFDPEIWKEDEVYYSLSGTHTGGVREEDCHVIMHLFRSENLAEWEYLGPFLEDESFTDPGEDGAVPNFFSLGDTHMVLFFSHTRGPQYYVGTYDTETHRFEIDSHGRLNFGDAYHGNVHAPSSLLAPDGRRIAFFNVNTQRRTLRSDPVNGWTELISLPRVIDYDNGTVTVRPVAELESLRTGHRRVEPRELRPNEEQVLENVGGSSIEVRATIDVNDAAEIGMNVLRSPDATETTTLSYWSDVDELGIDTSQSSQRKDILGRSPEIGPLELAPDEPLELQLYVDRSVIEVFANDRQCLTARVYPDRADSTGISLYARRGQARLESMDVWQMESIWE